MREIKSEIKYKITLDEDQKAVAIIDEFYGWLSWTEILRLCDRYPCQVETKYFLLENVVMKKQWEEVINSELGVKPIMINSALVSAQNRKRLYWTNIDGITQPQDKGYVERCIGL